MTEVKHLVAVSVQDLCHGLYVAEPDRPWTEVPLPFQGQVIASGEDLDVLQRHCEFVYVERERSEAAALDALDRARADRGAGDSGDWGGRETGEPPDITSALAGRGTPDRERFARAVQAAADDRSAAREVLDRALEDARLGRSIDTADAQEAVGQLAVEVSDNASASMWLTSLRDKDELATVHSINVCVLALAFGRFLGFPHERLQRLGMGALLHDVGKVRLPDSILHKADALTAAEWQQVKRHPDDGCDIVGASEGVPEEVLTLIRNHHERIGGQGYPRGLRGREIPIDARIIALTNAYDAHTSDRIYRIGRPPDEVLQAFYNEADHLFGPKLTQAFIRCVGIFPVGSLVELDNAALGIVVGSEPSARLAPTVLLVRTPDGEYYDKRVLLNLALDRADGGSGRFVRRTLNPAHYDIDVAGIVAMEFGVVL